LNSGSDGLGVVVDTPTADVRVGDIFFLEVSMTNGGTRNVTITEIRLPSTLFEHAQVIAVDPAGSMGPQGSFTYDMTIAPTGRETVVFSLQALTPANITVEVEVLGGRTINLQTRSGLIFHPRWLRKWRLWKRLRQPC
jgi:hypothetical protein